MPRTAVSPRNDAKAGARPEGADRLASAWLLALPPRVAALRDGGHRAAGAIQAVCEPRARSHRSAVSGTPPGDESGPEEGRSRALPFTHFTCRNAPAGPARLGLGPAQGREQTPGLARQEASAERLGIQTRQTEECLRLCRRAGVNRGWGLTAQLAQRVRASIHERRDRARIEEQSQNGGRTRPLRAPSMPSRKPSSPVRRRCRSASLK